MSGKNRALARARVKNYRRALRKARRKGQLPKDRSQHPRPATMSDFSPQMKFGNGGTDKSFIKRPGVYYSDAPFRRD